MKEATRNYYNTHPQTDSNLLPHWVVMYEEIAKILPPDSNTKILDLGCGAGFFASFLKKLGYKSYHGVDFAETLIARAREKLPEFNFTAESVYSERLQIDEFPKYELFIFIEFLQLLQNDLEVLAAIPRGKMIIFSVPNKGGIGVVRRFKSITQVRKRYEESIALDEVKSLPPSIKGKVYFLGWGKRR